MASSVLDHVQDKNHSELVRLYSLYSDVLPEYIKQADQNLFTERPAKHFAFPQQNVFPCHNKVNTFLSAMFWEEKKAQFSPKFREPIQETLDKYIDYWKIKADVSRLREKSAALEKQAKTELPDSDYAYVWIVNGTNEKERLYPLRNAIEVKTAADWLFQYREQIPFIDRNTIATKILEKASKYQAKITDHLEFLQKQAGRGICNPTEVVQQVKARRELIKDAELRLKVNSFINALETSPRTSFNPDSLVKLASTIEQIDQLIGVKYGERFIRPDDLVFSVTFDKAAEAIHSQVQLTTGSIYDKEMLAKVASDELQSCFGNDFVKEVSTGQRIDLEKLAEVLPTMPLPDAKVFDSMMNELGLRPHMKVASNVVGFAEDQMKELSKHYGHIIGQSSTN